MKNVGICASTKHAVSIIFGVNNSVAWDSCHSVAPNAFFVCLQCHIVCICIFLFKKNVICEA